MAENCAPLAAVPDACPDLAAVRDAYLAMLPQGRAWDRDAPVRRGVFTALAAARLDVEDRICALEDEFFCATTVAMRPEWLADYGLPDACEPYPDLCAKVAAQPDPRCEGIVEAAAAAGWSVACLPSERCGTRIGRATGSAPARAGRMRAGGGRIRATIVLGVDLEGSAAYTGLRVAPPRAGRLRAGHRLSCPPDLDSLKCLIARIAPGHVAVVYLVTDLSAAWDFSLPGDPLYFLL